MMTSVDGWPCSGSELGETVKSAKPPPQPRGDPRILIGAASHDFARDLHSCPIRKLHTSERFPLWTPHRYQLSAEDRLRAPVPAEPDRPVASLVGEGFEPDGHRQQSAEALPCSLDVACEHPAPVGQTAAQSALDL